MLLRVLFLAAIVFSTHAVSGNLIPADSKLKTSDRTKVIFFGWEGSSPSVVAGVSAMIMVDETPYLFDFGSGIFSQLLAARDFGLAKGFEPGKINVSFLTHLHSDHTTGYADLILLPWGMEGSRRRELPLKVFGPHGLKEMTRNILEAYAKDIDCRVFGLQNLTDEGVAVKAEEIDGNFVFKDERVTVKAFPVQHGNWPQAFGFRVETPDRVIVLSGDTRPTDDLLKSAKGSDILMHEVYGESSVPPSFLQYAKSYHTSGVELGIIASKVKPKLLVAYHWVTEGSKSAEEAKKAILSEIRRNYDGPVAFAQRLDVL